MVKANWLIRLYSPRDYTKTISFVGSFRKYGNRQLDNVLVYSGLYGIDFMVWSIHKNIESYDFGATNLELRLFLFGDSKKPSWHKKYKVFDIKHIPSKGKYLLFAMSEDMAVLKEKIAGFGVKSLKFEQNRKPYDVLREVLQGNGIFKVRYQDHIDKKLVEFEYRQLNIDYDWSVGDFINYICDENNYEWYLKNKILYVGKELKAIKEMVSAYKTEDSDYISETPFFKKYEGEPRPMDVMSHWNQTWRCIWAKHLVGSSGGLTKGCFTKRGSGFVSKKTYFSTLEGKIEKQFGTKLLTEANTYSVNLGNIMSDSGKEKYIDEVSIQKNNKNLKVKTPEDIIFDRGDGIPLINTKEKVSRSTPYLDYNAGLLFPVSTLEENGPNLLIFQPFGRLESQVQGPFVMGNGSDGFKLIKKNPGDFRLQLPNKWCLYISEEGEFILQKEANPESLPDSSGTYIKWDKDGKIEIESEEDTKITVNGNTIIKSVGDTKITAGGNTVIDSGSGSVDIKTTGSVNVGPSASSVKIAGGGKKISHVDHKHNYQHIHETGNMGMPVTPQKVSIPGAIFTDTHLPIEGSIKTEVD